MIQHDFSPAANPQCPHVATVAFGGSGGIPVQDWGLCTYGTELIWQLPSSASEQSGSVDILAMLTWLTSHRYLPSDSALWAIDYGWEICSTGGADENFQVSSFSATRAFPVAPAPARYRLGLAARASHLAFAVRRQADSAGTAASLLRSQVR